MNSSTRVDRGTRGRTEGVARRASWLGAALGFAVLGCGFGAIYAAPVPVSEPASEAGADDNSEIELPLVETVAIEMGVDGDARLTWGSQSGGAVEILSRLGFRYRRAAGTDPCPVELRCDARATFGRVNEMFEACERHGVPGVRMIVASRAGDESSLLVHLGAADSKALVSSGEAIRVIASGKGRPGQFSGILRVGDEFVVQSVSQGGPMGEPPARYFGRGIEDNVRRGLREANAYRIRTCVIDANADLPYGAFVEVVDMLAREGVTTLRVGGLVRGERTEEVDPAGLSDARDPAPTPRVAREGDDAAAIESALAWLAEHQHPDGHWDVDAFHENCTEESECTGGGYPLYDVGVTGLALLAFLGDGHTHEVGDYRENVKLATMWLRRQQDQEGCFGARVAQNFTYNHAIATLAVVEIYRLTDSPLFKRAATKGVEFIQTCRNPYGAWRYGVRPGDADTSVTSWMATALARGKAAGIAVPSEPFDEARKFLQSVTDESGRVGYTTRGIGPVRPVGREDDFPSDRSESLTAAGVFVRMLLGEELDEHAGLREGARLCAAKVPVWETPNLDFYYWYFGSRAMEQIGGEPAETWNAALRKAVIPAQVHGTCSGGSWDPIDAWSSEGGRIYSTTLLALALQASNKR